MKKAILYTDGGARGNPGPAGIGIVLVLDGDKVIEDGEYIGEATNNQAEYLALLKGLRRAAEEGVTDLLVLMDSELIVKQIKGQYRVKNADLRVHYEAAKSVMDSFKGIVFKHVPRKKNKRADKLVNQAIDKITYLK